LLYHLLSTLRNHNDDKDKNNEDDHDLDAHDDVLVKDYVKYKNLPETLSSKIVNFSANSSS